MFCRRVHSTNDKSSWVLSSPARTDQPWELEPLDPERPSVDSVLTIIESCSARAFQDTDDADFRVKLGNLLAERDVMPLRRASNAVIQRVERVEVVVLLLVNDHLQIGKSSLHLLRTNPIAQFDVAAGYQRAGSDCRILTAGGAQN